MLPAGYREHDEDWIVSDTWEQRAHEWECWVYYASQSFKTDMRLTGLALTLLKWRAKLNLAYRVEYSTPRIRVVAYLTSGTRSRIVEVTHL